MDRQGDNSRDTGFNMKILFNVNDPSVHPDIVTIVRRFSSFRSAISRPGTNTDGWGGLFLNMREFIRAMIIGTRQTVRMRDQSTQTDPHLLDISGHNTNSQETYFDSQETFFDPSAPDFPDPQ